MKAQVYPIFPEPIVEFTELGIDEGEIENLYERQEWANTNADDDPDKFLKISQNLRVLNQEAAIRKKFEDVVNEYTKEVMRYNNTFCMTTSWFVKTEQNKISVIHNHGNAVICAVYYFGLSSNNKAKIKFEKPFLSQYDIKPIEYNIFNGASHDFSMGNNTLLVFPAYLKHKVIRHENRETRKSLAMNFMPTGVIGVGATEIDLGAQVG